MVWHGSGTWLPSRGVQLVYDPADGNEWRRQTLRSKPFLTVIAVVAVAVAYGILIQAVEWFRANAGVASDTGTPIDVLAWYWCIFSASAIAANVGYELLRTAGVKALACMFAAVAVLLVLHLNDGLIVDGFSAAFGMLVGPALAWSISSGILVGWLGARGGEKARGVWRAVAMLAAALLTIALVFYPADCYFMRTFGGN